MATAEHCRTMADEAERLANIVSYGRDKMRLREQACEWRERAQTLEAARADASASPAHGGGVKGWLQRRCS